MSKLGFKYFIMFLALFLIFLTLDMWQMDRLEYGVRNTLETAEQAAIIAGMDADSMMFINKDEVYFKKDEAETVFKKELVRGLKLDSHLKPTKGIKDFELSYLKINIVNGMPVITAGVKVQASLIVAPYLGISDTIKMDLADRHTVVWK